MQYLKTTDDELFGIIIEPSDTIEEVAAYTGKTVYELIKILQKEIKI